MNELNRWKETSVESFAIATESQLPLLQKISSENRDAKFEWFHRTSIARRVRFDDGRPSDRVGYESGGALRWFDPQHSLLRFASSSGTPTRALERSYELATGLPGSTVAQIPWEEGASPGDDDDHIRRLPQRDELVDWIERTASEAPEPAQSAWVEVALTLESRLTSAGTFQRRLRGRAWSGWQPHSAARHGDGPLLSAARTWSTLQQRDMTFRWRDRAVQAGRRLPWPAGVNLVFSPETSAIVVRPLVAALHRPGAERGLSVGPGWVVSDRPGDRTALFGATHDDAGFATRERVLADGRRIEADWGGAGCLRRGSFRDAPVATPACIRLEPPMVDPPKRSVWVVHADLHPGAPGEWLIQLHGRQFPDGSPLEPCWLRVSPEMLARACRGGLGAPSQSHFGVVTPALVFDALLLGA